MSNRFDVPFCAALLWTSLGCGDAPHPEKRNPLPIRPVADPLASGEVVEVAFDRNGKSLIVLNEYKAYGNRAKQHTRLRRFSIIDWKPIRDTGELSIYESYFAKALNGPWLLQGMWFERSTPNNSSPLTERGAAFLEMDPQTLKMRDIDIVRRDASGQILFASALALDSKAKMGVLQMDSRGRTSPAAYTFDPETGKKKIDLANFQTRPDPEHMDWDKGNCRHTDTILEFTPDDKRIVSFVPMKAFRLQMHDAHSGELVRILTLPSEAQVASLKVSPDGKVLAAECWNGDLLVLAPDLSKVIRKLNVLADERPLGRQAIAFIGNQYLAAISGRKNIEVFDTTNWKSVQTFEGNGDTINAVASSPDGKLLAAGFGETTRTPGIVRVWNVGTKKLVAELY